jgi:hypothetical protein
VWSCLRLQGQWFRSVELWVIHPNIPMFICFSNCGLGEGFASHWLWDLWMPIWVPWSSCFKAVSHHWGLGLLTIHYLAQSSCLCLLIPKSILKGISQCIPAVTKLCSVQPLLLLYLNPSLSPSIIIQSFQYILGSIKK